MQHNEFKGNTHVFNTFPSNLEPHILFDYLAALYKTESKNPQSLPKTLKNLALLPDYLLMYLMVEIELMTKENGCFAYANRQPGSLTACFEALTYVSRLALNDPSSAYPSKQLFTTIHGMLSDINKVKIPNLQQRDSGQYRTNNDEALSISIQDVSVNGIHYLLSLMKTTFKTMGIAGDRDIMDVKRDEAKILELQQIIRLLKYIQTNRPQTQELITNINSILNHSHQPIELQKLFERNKFKYIFVNEVCECFPESEEAEQDDEHEDGKDAADDEFTILVTQLNSIASDDWQSFIPYINDLLGKDYGVQILNNTIKRFEEKIEQIEMELPSKRKYIISDDTMSAAKSYYHARTDDEMVDAFLNRLHQTGQGLNIQFIKQTEFNELLQNISWEFESNFPSMVGRPDEEKFTFLYKHIQLLLLVHPFVEANNRTFVNVLGLVWHAMLELPGLPVYYNPFVFYAHSPDEVIEAVKLSCANFIAMLEAVKNNDHQHFNSLLQTFTDVQNNQMRDYAKPFHDFLSRFVIEDFILQINRAVEKNLTEEASVGFFKPLNELRQIAFEDIKKLKTFDKLETCINYLKDQIKNSSDRETKLTEIYKEILNNNVKEPNRLTIS